MKENQEEKAKQSSQAPAIRWRKFAASANRDYKRYAQPIYTCIPCQRKRVSSTMMKISTTAIALALLAAARISYAVDVSDVDVDPSMYKILVDAEKADEGVPHRHAGKTKGQIALQPSFVRKIQAGGGIFATDATNGGNAGGSTITSMTSMTQTSEEHVDSKLLTENRSNLLPKEDRVGFIFLNTNDDAHFDVDDTCVPVQKNRLVMFDGARSVHHTVIHKGRVSLLGPFHAKTFVGVEENTGPPPVCTGTCCVSGYCRDSPPPVRRLEVSRKLSHTLDGCPGGPCCQNGCAETCDDVNCECCLPGYWCRQNIGLNRRLEAHTDRRLDQLCSDTADPNDRCCVDGACYAPDCEGDLRGTCCSGTCSSDTIPVFTGCAQGESCCVPGDKCKACARECETDEGETGCSYVMPIGPPQHAQAKRRGGPRRLGGNCVNQCKSKLQGRGRGSKTLQMYNPDYNAHDCKNDLPPPACHDYHGDEMCGTGDLSHCKPCIGYHEDGSIMYTLCISEGTTSCESMYTTEPQDTCPGPDAVDVPFNGTNYENPNENCFKCGFLCMTGPCCEVIPDKGTCNSLENCQWDPYCSRGGKCLASTMPCNDGGYYYYRRVLSSFHLQDEKHRHLFALLEGDELEKHQRLYEEKKTDPFSVGLCDHKDSEYYGVSGITHDECLRSVSPNFSNESNENSANEYEPWIVPTAERAALLSPNPGIWSVDDLFDEGEIKQLLQLIDEYGHVDEMFGPCRDSNKMRQNAMQTENKVCFKISPENVCEGPYALSDCTAKVRPRDTDIIKQLLFKINDIWNIEFEPHAKVQLSTGGTPPMDLHYDDYTMSTILYLTDGGASAFFPNADVTILPKKGTVYTWINTFKDGSKNPMADHAVQAHPEDGGDRLMILFEVTASPQQLFASLRG